MKKKRLEIGKLYRITNNKDFHPVSLPLSYKTTIQVTPEEEKLLLFLGEEVGKYEFIFSIEKFLFPDGKVYKAGFFLTPEDVLHCYFEEVKIS